VVFNANGDLIAQGKWFDEDFVVVDHEFEGSHKSRRSCPLKRAIYKALVLGLRDYFYKCGFKSAVLGLSGGIDSALTVCIAVDALGKENVRGVSLPSQFSSQGSLDDARVLAGRLGVQYDVVPIKKSVRDGEGTTQAVICGKSRGHDGGKTCRRGLRGVILIGAVE